MRFTGSLSNITRASFRRHSFGHFACSLAKRFWSLFQPVHFEGNNRLVRRVPPPPRPACSSTWYYSSQWLALTAGDRATFCRPGLRRTLTVRPRCTRFGTSGIRKPKPALASRSAPGTTHYFPAGPIPPGGAIYSVNMTCPPWNPASSCTATTVISDVQLLTDINALVFNDLGGPAY